MLTATAVCGVALGSGVGEATAVGTSVGFAGAGWVGTAVGGVVGSAGVDWVGTAVLTATTGGVASAAGSGWQATSRLRVRRKIERIRRFVMWVSPVRDMGVSLGQLLAEQAHLQSVPMAVLAGSDENEHGRVRGECLTRPWDNVFRAKAYGSG